MLPQNSAKASDDGELLDGNNEVLVDRKNMKIVSQEAADDRSAEWATAVIADANDSGTWKFYFKDEVPEDVSRRLLSDLGS